MVVREASKTPGRAGHVEAGGKPGAAGERSEQGSALWRGVGTDPCKALWVGVLGCKGDGCGPRGEAEMVVQVVKVESQGRIQEFSRQRN